MSHAAKQRLLTLIAANIRVHQRCADQRLREHDADPSSNVHLVMVDRHLAASKELIEAWDTIMDLRAEAAFASDHPEVFAREESLTCSHVSARPSGSSQLH